jgi:hypothetical protein
MRKPAAQRCAQVSPDAGILMGEHYNLHAILRHVLSHGSVGCHHVTSERLILAFDGVSTP